MDYSLPRPCSDCPFLRDGGIRLSRTRIREIAGAMLHTQGATFQCHKTVKWDVDENGVPVSVDSKGARHCAGALIFAEKQGCANQMMRISERLGLYNPAALMADATAVESVFGSLSEMLKTAI